MKYSEQRELVSTLRELADFYERPSSIVLPCPRFRDTAYVSVTSEWNSETQEYEYDQFATADNLRKIARAAAPVEKFADDYAYGLKRKFGKLIELRWQANRKAVCERKQVGTKVVPAYSTPERIEPVYEYNCKPSILADWS
jgi:hypothetical protein